MIIMGRLAANDTAEGNKAVISRAAGNGEIYGGRDFHCPRHFNHLKIRTGCFERRGCPAKKLIRDLRVKPRFNDQNVWRRTHMLVPCDPPE